MIHSLPQLPEALAFPVLLKKSAGRSGEEPGPFQVLLS